MKSNQNWSYLGSHHHHADAALGGGGDNSAAQHRPSRSNLASTQLGSNSEDVVDSYSTHTVIAETMEDTIRLDRLDITNNTMAMNSHIKQNHRSLSSTASASASFAEDLKDVEKDGFASTLVQQEIDAYENIGSDHPTLVSKRAHTTPTPSNDMNLNKYDPPKELMPLPRKRASPLWRRLRHRLLAVYQRLFSIVLIGNVVAFITVLVLDRNAQPFGPPLGNVASAVAANVTGAILIRQEYCINALFNILCWTPLWMPLRFRRVVAKFYHFGGVHSGCAVCAVGWFILYAALLTQQYVNKEFRVTAVQIAIVSITYSLLVLFLAITIFAIPRFRIFSHNTFEAIHRFGGWLAVALFWVLLVLSDHAQSKVPGSPSLGLLLVQSPASWLLLAVTLSIIIPWLRLRKVAVHAEKLSMHAIRLHFNYIHRIGPVVGIRIATSPLKEWHAFAAIPSANSYSSSSFSIIVSNAGDWTKQQIDNPAATYWVRGIPITGVLRMASVFRKVVVVTTGSGIGPVLSMVFSSSRMASCRIIWSTPNPLDMYGQGIVDAVASADCDAVIWNTRVRGRPDMPGLAHHLYVESGAEAVFVISNPALTRKVVYEMESRGVPAFGPIWDS